VAAARAETEAYREESASLLNRVSEDLSTRVTALEEGYLLLSERVERVESLLGNKAAAEETEELRSLFSRCALREEAAEGAERAMRHATASALRGTHRAWEAGIAALGSDLSGADRRALLAGVDLALVREKNRHVYISLYL